MGEIFDTLASWAVTLGSGKGDQQLQKKAQNAVQRAVELKLEWICSFEMSWKFLFARSLSVLGISEFWTISDWTEFGLVKPSLISSDFSCREFYTVFIFLHDMSMGFMRRNHCDLFCSHVKGCACIDSWV